MKFFGNADLQLNYLTQANIELYDGSSTSFPAGSQGRLLLRTDTYQLYVCVSTNPDVWQPLIKVADTYVHTQSSAATTWTINHGLQTSNVIVQVYDSNNDQIIPETINVTNDNTVEVDVSPSSTGKCIIAAIDTNIGTFVQYNSLSQDVTHSGKEITSITYNSDNKPTEVNYSDGVKAELTYVESGNNGEGEISTLTFKNSVGTIIEQWTYNYDSSDRLASTTKIV